MIISRLTGGLGNQMFQYAAGRALAIKHGTELKLDISTYSNQAPGDTPRHYLLTSFGISENYASAKEIRQLRGRQKGRLEKKLRRVFGISPLGSKHFIEKEGADFDERFLELKKDVYLEGWFQSERYFENITQQLRQDFSLKASIKPFSEKYNDALKIGTPVSIHIRRGDYVSNPNATAYHGVLGNDYYQKAVKIISEQVNNPHYLIFAEFTEDIKWAKENLALPADSTFVEPQEIYQDLWLMSRCQHNIVANSTFSWWSAWLNPNPDKIIIAPKDWFKGKAVNIDERLPKDWLKI
jgi:hypothetical protein